MKKRILILCLCTMALANNAGSLNILPKHMDYDFRQVFNSDTMFIGASADPKFPALGYIGKDYQRFYIHYSQIMKNASQQSYRISGKTKVKNTVCLFSGVLSLDSLLKGDVSEGDSSIWDGDLVGHYVFTESDCKYPGTLQGTVHSLVSIPKSGKAEYYYNTSMAGADGYENNQFTGIWIDSKTKASKVCNWGDFRIPESEDLDAGAAEFSPYEKYDAKGWKTYRLMLQDDSASMGLERSPWWK